MRRLMCVLMVIALASAMGCSGRQQPVGAPNATSPSDGEKHAVPGAEPAPEPAQSVPGTNVEPSGGEAICDALPGTYADYRLWEQRLTVRLATALNGINTTEAPEVIRRLGDCLKVKPVAASTGKMMALSLDTKSPSFFSQFGMAVWQFDGKWQVNSLLVDESSGLLIKRCQDTSAGLEVVAELRVDGTGHIGGFRLNRLGRDVNLLWESRPYDHFAGQLLGDHFLVGTYRDEKVYDEPHFYAGNCCYPITGQTLWERQGDAYMERAARNYPSVLQIASAFVGAWNQNKLEMAGNWAVNPQVIQQMLGGAQAPPVIGLTNEPAGLYDIEKTEAAYWDALPAALRGPAPTVTEFVWPATPKPILLKRINGQWRVAGWR